MAKIVMRAVGPTQESVSRLKKPKPKPPEPGQLLFAEGRPFKAKFPGRCPVCYGPIKVGERILPVKKVGSDDRLYRHKGCVSGVRVPVQTPKIPTVEAPQRPTPAKKPSKRQRKRLSKAEKKAAAPRPSDGVAPPQMPDRSWDKAIRDRGLHKKIGPVVPVSREDDWY